MDAHPDAGLSGNGNDLLQKKNQIFPQLMWTDTRIGIQDGLKLLQSITFLSTRKPGDDIVDEFRFLGFGKLINISFCSGFDLIRII